MAGQRTSLASLRVGKAAVPELASAPKWPDTVKLKDLADNPDNPREELRDLEGLAATIKERGILQRLVVVPRATWLTAHPHHTEKIGNAPFVILIGHRRRHAAELAGLDEVKVEVRESASGSRTDALIENIQRSDLDPLEEANGIRDLMEEEGLSQRGVAELLGKSQGWVSQRLVLLKLIPELQQAITNGTLRIEDAREIGKLPPQEQALPVLPVPAPKLDLAQPVRGGHNPIDASVDTAPSPRMGKGAKTSRGHSDYGVITLGPPASIAAALRERLSLEDLETLVELLSATTAR
ncbi:ParB/RepB/Spo0J family partition protein [Streptosporangium sp. NPDC049248]|uniref:ParB/RepB/Spo0J family partition protein n=1 Tax=Streptosporangium sp. NPDC049248 TaxID=3155651 RepID=UPI00344A25A7